MLKDPMEPRVDITLRVSIKGNGIELRTRDDYRPQPLELNGGVPLVLTGPDLESYLNPANLTFSGISKNEFVKTGKLPEGVYQFTVEALSYDRPGVVLSNSGMTIGWLVLNDPPHWTLPMQNSLLTATYPQFVNFSWMPMNTGSPNAAFTTEYEFTMVELWPEDRSPGDAINSFAPLFQTVTNNTSLVYGPAEPELTPGRKYVCRLRAYDTEGRDLFKNNGYSEILVFTFGQACLPPNTFTDKIISPEEARVEWTALPGHTQFNLSYSEQNPDGTWSNWYHNEGIMPYSNLKELKPERKYRYQLKAICGTIESEYSEIKEFATPAADTTEIVCGKGAGVPDIDDSPPLPTLHIGDRIDAGGFTALVTEAEGSNGNFTGKCILFVKTFGYAPIYSEFSGIGVNQSMQLTSGSIKSVKGELKIHSVDSIISDLNDMLGSDDVADGGNGNPNVGDPYQPGDTVTVTLGGEDFIITSDTTIITASGDTITTDFSQVPPIIVVNGDSTDVTTDELDFDNPGGGSDGTSDVASNVSDTAAYAITLVKFRPAKDQFFGFDQYPEDISQFQPDYSKEKVNKKDYPVHWKSTQSPGMSDKVVMEITAGVPDSIRTRLSIESSVSGPLNYNFNANDSIWEVIVTGKSHQDEDHIIAWYTQDDGSRIAVGHLNLVSYNKQNMKLVIVPVNKDYTVEANALKDSLDNIYKGAITFWDVSVLTEPLEVEFEDNDKEGLDTDLPDMAAYTREMKNIRKAMKKRDDHDPNAQYLFLVAKSEDGEKNGIMPFRRRYGFIFMENTKHSSSEKLINNKEKLFHTAAHELGHGPFGLRHPWQERGTTQGATYNLMDYSNKKPNNLLRKYQWHYIHNPKASLFGGDEESTSDVNADVKLKTKEGISLKENVPELEKTYCFLTASLVPVWLKEATELSFFENGTLAGFTVNNVKYSAITNDIESYLYLYYDFDDFKAIASNPSRQTKGLILYQNLNQDKIFKNYQVAKNGDRIFVYKDYTRLGIDCIKMQSWEVGNSPPNNIQGTFSDPVAPATATTLKESGECFLLDIVNQYQIGEGIGRDFFVLFYEGCNDNQTELDDLVAFCNQLNKEEGENCKGKKHQLSDEFAKELKDNNVNSLKDFKANYYYGYSLGSLVIAKEDLWIYLTDDYNKSTPNTVYSVSELRIRYQILKEGGQLAYSILNAEKAGKAYPLTMDRFVDKYGGASSLVAFILFFELQADLVDINAGVEVSTKALKFFKKPKTKPFTAESIANKRTLRDIKLNELLNKLVPKIKTNLVNRVAKEADNMSLNHLSDDAIKKIIENGKKMDLPDKEIEDIIFNGCRKNKQFGKEELIAQTDFWKKVKNRGYPNLFSNLQDYEKFSGIINNLAKKWDLPKDKIFVQGSSLRVADVTKIGDIDVAIKVDANTFQKLTNKYQSYVTSDKVLKRIGKNGKIGGLDMFSSSDIGKKSFTIEFYNSFEKIYKQNFTSKFGVEKIQLSIIKEGSVIDVSPFLKLK